MSSVHLSLSLLDLEERLGNFRRERDFHELHSNNLNTDNLALCLDHFSHAFSDNLSIRHQGCLTFSWSVRELWANGLQYSESLVLDVFTSIIDSIQSLNGIRYSIIQSCWNVHWWTIGIWHWRAIHFHGDNPGRNSVAGVEANQWIKQATGLWFLINNFTEGLKYHNLSLLDDLAGHAHDSRPGKEETQATAKCRKQILTTFKRVYLNFFDGCLAFIFWQLFQSLKLLLQLLVKLIFKIWHLL